MILTTAKYTATCDDCSTRVQAYIGETVGHVVVHNRQEFVAALREQGWEVGPYNTSRCFDCVDA